MNKEAFGDLSLEDPRRRQNTDYQNDLLDEICDSLDLYRNSIGGSAVAVDDIERACRFLRYGSEPEKSPLITDADKEWFFTSENGDTFTFKPDDPEDEWR